MNESALEGFVKIVAERKYGELLGVHMIGPHVTDMIAAGVAKPNAQGQAITSTATARIKA